MHRWFNRIRQVASLCTPSSTTLLPPAESLWVYRPPRMSQHVLDRPLFPLITAPSWVEIWTPSHTWLHGPTLVHTPNGISIGSAVFAGHMIVTDQQTDWQTDHATPSVTIGHIFVVRFVGWLEFNVPFSTNTAISELKGQGWRVILLPSEGTLAIY